MTRINLGEKHESAFSVHSMGFQDELKEEHQPEKQPVSSNETAKREMATELINQGFSEEAICRILNLSPEQLPETLS